MVLAGALPAWRSRCNGSPVSLTLPGGGVCSPVALPCLPRCFTLPVCAVPAPPLPRVAVLSRSPCVIPGAHLCTGRVALSRRVCSLTGGRVPFRLTAATAHCSRALVHSCSGHFKGRNSSRCTVPAPRGGRTTPGVWAGRVLLPRCSRVWAHHSRRVLIAWTYNVTLLLTHIIFIHGLTCCFTPDFTKRFAVWFNCLRRQGNSPSHQGSKGGTHNVQGYQRSV